MLEGMVLSSVMPSIVWASQSMKWQAGGHIAVHKMTAKFAK